MGFVYFCVPVTFGYFLLGYVKEAQEKKWGGGAVASRSAGSSEGDE